jgi:hypothetical protein
VDTITDEVKAIKDTIHNFLELFREIFKADVCYLYLVNKAMDNHEKAIYLSERMEIIQNIYKKHEKQLPPYLMRYVSTDKKKTIDDAEILNSIDILKFIDVAKKDGVNRWNLTHEIRPAKYVLFRELQKNEEILGEGITAYMVRVNHAQLIFNSEKELKDHLHASLSNSTNKITDTCRLVIGFPLTDNKGHKIGILKIENYERCKSEESQKEKEYIRNFKCKVEYTGDYQYNEKNEQIIEVKNYIPLLTRFIISSEKSFQKSSYDSLFNGICLLENLKNLKFPVSNSKIKSLDPEGNISISDSTNELDNVIMAPAHAINKAIYADTKHLFLVLKRKEYVGYVDILKRVTDYVKGISVKLGLDTGIIKYFEYNLDQFQKHEELLLSGLNKYRDHFMHQFHVFVSGYIIINELGIEHFKSSIQQSMEWILTNNKRSNQIAFDKDEKRYEISDADVLRIWFLTAFYHDFAYILEKLDTELQNFFEHLLGYPFNVKFDWENLLTDKNSFSKYICDLLAFFSSPKGTNAEQLLQNYLNAIIKVHDHGILSALLLINSSKRTTYRNRNECFYAASAISLHNPEVYGSLSEGECISQGRLIGISFESFPMAFLLAFCDTAQSFGRIEMSERKKINDYPVQFFGISIDVNEKVIYKLLYTDVNKTPTVEQINEWASMALNEDRDVKINDKLLLKVQSNDEGRIKVNKIFKSFEYSFVIEYYKPKKVNKTEEENESMCAKDNIDTNEQELICSLYF